MANKIERAPGQWARIMDRVRALFQRGLKEAPQQFAHQSGHDNILVQAISSIVRIGPSDVQLTLERRHVSKREIRSEVDLLRPEVEATELVGRDEILAQLVDWLDSPDPISIHTIIARGGSGKTRLGLKLCAIAEEKKWMAGFVTAEELRRFAEHERIADWDWREPTLVIIDYAARCARPLNVVLRTLVRQNDKRPQLRFLLLDRHADPQAGWWAEVRQASGSSDDRILDWFTDAQPQELPPIEAADSRRTILKSVLAAWTQLGFGETAPRVPAAGEDAAFDQALAGENVEREPLYLMMAGLISAEHGLVTSLSVSRLDLALWLAIRERDRLMALARSNGVNERLLPHLVARITLSRGVPKMALPEIIQEERTALRVERGVELEAVGHALGSALPSRAVSDTAEGSLTGFIEPDVVGETFCLLVLTGLDAGTKEALVQRCAAHSLQRTAQQLVLIIQDYARELPENPTRVALARRYPEFAALPTWLGEGNPALGWLVKLAQSAGRLEQLIEIGDQLPHQTLVLGKLALGITSAVQGVLRAIPEAKRTIEQQAYLPNALNNHGERLSSFGRHTEALQATEEAVAIYRKLATTLPDPFLLFLANTLNNLSVRFFNLGRLEEGLAATEEAVEIFRASSLTQTNDWLPLFARALNNLGNRRAALGRHTEALQATEEAVAIHRKLVAIRPDTFLSDLAASVGNLGNRRAAVGRHTEAFQATEEAVAIHRKLVAIRPDEFLAKLGVSLHQLGGALSKLGRDDDAICTSKEAVQIFRKLAAIQPDAFLHYLAGTLNSTGNWLYRLGRLDEALQACRDSVEIYRNLSQIHPDRFRPELAVSMTALANCLKDLGQLSEALDANVQAITNLREPFLRLPRAFETQMMLMIGQHNEICRKLGRAPDKEFLWPIVELWDRLNREQPFGEGG